MTVAELVVKLQGMDQKAKVMVATLGGSLNESGDEELKTLAREDKLYYQSVGHCFEAAGQVYVSRLL